MNSAGFAFTLTPCGKPIRSTVRKKKALLLGYFPASSTDPGENLPGGIVFCSLSHDIIAHETTHALLDGLHRYFGEPTNQDVLAFGIYARAEKRHSRFPRETGFRSTSGSKKTR